jgi:hypothetical protein
MCQTAALLQHVRKANRFASPVTPLAPLRWMGCMIAVYDCTVREKAKRKGGNLLCKRGTKRRGGRGARNPDRKRRRVATADPEDSSGHPLQGRVLTRLSYLIDRRIAWEKRTISVISSVRCARERSKRLPPDVRDQPARVKWRREHLKYIQRLTQRLVDVMSRSSGDSLGACRAKLRVYLLVLESGWDAIEPACTSESFVSLFQPGYHSVAPPSGMEGRRGMIERRLSDGRIVLVTPPSSVRRRVKPAIQYRKIIPGEQQGAASLGSPSGRSGAKVKTTVSKNHRGRRRA